MVVLRNMKELNERSSSHLIYTCITIKHMNPKVIDYKEDLLKFYYKHVYCPNRLWIFTDSYTFEEDAHHRLHMHILISSNVSIVIKPVRYWHVDAQTSSSPDKWDAYIHKEAKNQDEQDLILLRHASYHQNFFD